MRFVKDAVQVPQHCVFYPQIGGHHEQGFIEADGLLTGIHDTAYVSVVALKEIAQKFPQAGLCPRSDLTVAEAKAADLERQNEDLKAQMAEYDKELDAIHTIRGRGYSVQKKPGRKPAAKAA